MSPAPTPATTSERTTDSLSASTIVSGVRPRVVNSSVASAWCELIGGVITHGSAAIGAQSSPSTRSRQAAGTTTR